MENYTWKLGSFATGDIIDIPLHVINEPEIDISVDNEDTATLTILMTPYSDTIRNSWASYFKEVLHFCVAIGETSGDVLWAGMINKITPSIAEQTLEFQLVNPKEYTSARIVGETFGEVVEDPTSGVEIEGANYSEIIAGLVRRCFAPIARANTPQPPNILLEALPAKTGDSKKMTFLYSDMVSYSEAIENAIEESGLDIETRYSAVWGNEAKTKVKWQFVAGSDSAPHINENSTISIELRDAENIRKVSEFESLVDSTELFNSFYISSKSGDEEAKSGMDLKNAVSYDSNFPILLETYYSPGVELSEAQLNSQLTSYISQGMNTKRTGSVTIELESEDFILWAHSYLGRIVNFTGYDNTLSAGHSVSLRIVGVRFDLSSGRVLIDLMSKQPRYPKLPRKKGAKSKKKNDNKKISPSNRLVKAKDVAKFKGGGGLPPTPPWEGGGAYPPSDAGPGGGYGTGSESVKDDDSPYAITNYGKSWNVGSLGQNTYPSAYTAQNQGNIVCQTRNSSMGTFEWTEDKIGIQNINNSSKSEAKFFLGTGYLLEGELMSFDNERFLIDYSVMIDDILLNKHLWGVEFAETTVFGSNTYNYVNILRVQASVPKPFFIRDRIVMANQITITARYKYNTQIQSLIKTYIMFCSVQTLGWDQIGGLTLIPNATLKNNGLGNIVTRVGDYGIIETTTSFYVNNFSVPSSINEFNWYTIPKVTQIDGVTIEYSRNPKGVIGKVKIDGVFRNFLIAQGGIKSENGVFTNHNQKVYGIELMQGHQPIPIADSDWQDLSEFFPVPPSHSTQRSYMVDSVGGFLIYRIGGGNSSSATIYEEVYMQGENGSWNKLKTVDQVVNSIGPIVFQYDKYVYYVYSGNSVTQPRAFSLKKIAEWALPDPTTP